MHGRRPRKIVYVPTDGERQVSRGQVFRSVFVVYVRACVRACVRAVTSLRPHFKDVPKRDQISLIVTLAVPMRVYFGCVLRLTFADSPKTAPSGSQNRTEAP